MMAVMQAASARRRGEPVAPGQLSGLTCEAGALVLQFALTYDDRGGAVL